MPFWHEPGVGGGAETWMDQKTKRKGGEGSLKVKPTTKRRVGGGG